MIFSRALLSCSAHRVGGGGIKRALCHENRNRIGKAALERSHHQKPTTEDEEGRGQDHFRMVRFISTRTCYKYKHTIMKEGIAYYYGIFSVSKTHKHDILSHELFVLLCNIQNLLILCTHIWSEINNLIMAINQNIEIEGQILFTR